MANELTRGFNGLFGNDDFFNSFGHPFFNMSDIKEMKTDVAESDKDYTVAIDLPGIDKKDIHADFKDGVLTVSAKRDSFSDDADSNGNVIASERSYGRFSRQYQLPGVDEQNVSAKYDDGVLKITLPKATKEISDNHTIAIN